MLLLIAVMKILVPRLRCKKEAEKEKEGLKLAVWWGGGGGASTVGMASSFYLQFNFDGATEVPDISHSLSAGTI